MNFPDTWEWIVGASPHTGAPKAQARQPIVPGERLLVRADSAAIRKAGHTVYETGRTYAVRKTRTTWPSARIRLDRIQQERRAGDIRDEDVRAEGFASREEFTLHYVARFGVAALDRPCWVLDFAVVVDDRTPSEKFVSWVRASPYWLRGAPRRWAEQHPELVHGLRAYGVHLAFVLPIALAVLILVGTLVHGTATAGTWVTGLSALGSLTAAWVALSIALSARGRDERLRHLSVRPLLSAQVTWREESDSQVHVEVTIRHEVGHPAITVRAAIERERAALGAAADHLPFVFAIPPQAYLLREGTAATFAGIMPHCTARRVFLLRYDYEDVLGGTWIARVPFSFGPAQDLPRINGREPTAVPEGIPTHVFLAPPHAPPDRFTQSTTLNGITSERIWERVEAENMAQPSGNSR